MSTGLPHTTTKGPNHNGAAHYNQPQYHQPQLSHEGVQQLANFHQHWYQNQVGHGPHHGYALAQAQPNPQPQPHHQYQHQPYHNSFPAHPPQPQFPLEDSAMNALQVTMQCLPQRDCGLAEWTSHEERVLISLRAFSLAIGARMNRERSSIVRQALNTITPGTYESIVMDTYSTYCKTQQIDCFPIHPLAAASFLTKTPATRRVAILTALEAIRHKTGGSFEHLALAPGLPGRINLSPKGWAVWEDFVGGARCPLFEWRVVKELLHVPPTPFPQHYNYNQPQPQHQHQPQPQPAQSTSQTLHTQPHGQSIGAVINKSQVIPSARPQSGPTPAPASASNTRKRGPSPSTVSKIGPNAAKEEEEFYSEVDKLKGVMDALVVKRQARHRALLVARTDPTSATSTAPPNTITALNLASHKVRARRAMLKASSLVPDSTIRPSPSVGGPSTLSGQGRARTQAFPALPRPDSVMGSSSMLLRPTSTAGVATSSVTRPATLEALPWTDYTPQVVPLQSGFAVAAPTKVGSPLGLPGKRKVFTPTSVPDSRIAPVQEAARSLRESWVPGSSAGAPFEEVQARLTLAAGANVGLGKPSALQRTLLLSRRQQSAPSPAAARPAASTSNITSHPSAVPSTARRRPSIAPISQLQTKPASSAHPSALGVIGLPALQPSSINRPALASTSRASSSAGMARTGSNGAAHSGRTPSLSGSNIHPLARLYGQISQQERKGVLQMVASRSPSCSQENSPRAGPPTSLGASPLVKYVEMGIEIAQAAVKERQGQGAVAAREKAIAVAQAAGLRSKGRERLEGLVAPPLVPVPSGLAQAEDHQMVTEPALAVSNPKPRPSPVKSVPLLRPDSPAPALEPEPGSPPLLLKYAPPLNPSAPPPPLTKVRVWSHPGFPSRPADAIKRVGLLTTKGVNGGAVDGMKGMKGVAGWVQRASRPAMPFKMVDK